MKKVVVLALAFCLLLSSCGSAPEPIVSEAVISVYEYYAEANDSLKRGDWDTFSHVVTKDFDNVLTEINDLSKKELAGLAKKLNVPYDGIKEKVTDDMLMFYSISTLGKMIHKSKGNEISLDAINYYLLLLTNPKLDPEQIEEYVFNMFWGFEEAYYESM
ncbi:MAG: hypothetical protein IKU44_01355 [Firmicutes bacterium]|nr:hypothetical protein [Bacillota bacterium]